MTLAGARHCTKDKVHLLMGIGINLDTARLCRDFGTVGRLIG